MSTRALIAAILLAVSAGRSEAANWLLEALFSETALYDSNPGLSPIAPSHAYGLLSNLTLNLIADGKTSKFSLETNLDYPRHWGPGAPPGGFQSSTVANFEARTKVSTLNLSASISQQNASTTELLDSGLVTIDATRLSRSLSLKYEREMGPRDSAILSASARASSFSGTSGPLVGSRGFDVSGTWRHRLTKRTDIDATLGYERFDPTDPTKADSDIHRATLGARLDVTKRLSVSGSAGAMWVNSTATTTAGHTASLGVEYKANNTTVVLSASDSVSPSSLGELQRIRSASLNIDHLINEVSGMSLAAGYSAFLAPTGSRSVLTVSPSYFHQLTRAARVDLVYRFTMAKTSVGTANSNSILLKLSKNFDIVH